MRDERPRHPHRQDPARPPASRDGPDKGHHGGARARTPAASTAEVEAWLLEARPGEALRARIDCPRYWLADASGSGTGPGTGANAGTAASNLHALLHREEGCTRVLVAPSAIQGPVRGLAAGDLDDLARRHGLPLFDLERPLPLAPVPVPKPWGRELWFTGIEARGVSRVIGRPGGHADEGRRDVGSDDYADAPAVLLPDLLALAPEWICRARARELVLLKILDPHADPEFGELYLELHEEKREAYVVTAIDRDLWPDGIGGIRLGIAQAARQAHDDPGLRAAFRQAIGQYEGVRRRIDALLDGFRGEQDTPGDLAHALALAKRVPAALQAEEREARAAMHAFMHVEPLRVGDVVNIPTHVPHALLPGVRVIEFQTPVYERRILAFGQKVLTQPHWDTEHAVANMQLDAPPSAPETISDDGLVRVECVARFPDFSVLRVHIAAHADACWQPPAADYALAIGVTGLARIADGTLAAEQAALVPTAALRWPVRNGGDAPATLLWAMPTTHGTTTAPPPQDTRIA